ncbi:hypothetical protein CWB89_00085 [Pseudoalteromonas piscicida]|uniref:Lipoprotein n=1 Tax=Pseudoalteromonas piscicida TaxID=43662 RepID=A0AAQ2ETL0_PSEO7|nr:MULTISPECIES: hypothetical protein [Pseudoalteromonas]MDP4486416.1 hypothetical protein [Pseudoalteromonas piscicida]TMN34009.1 hypothetical protein CWB95_21900 [Pseudoalteromonas piscicida]TMN40731.1 hypothetical protein CWB94_09395 [Pseudoalteromonas piscicida]TMN50774.1 hypothetical protein CWB91_13790 [Pseudoalteromonas piscicida]TMN57060.1 hypothetical protein CWB92_00615 [Pseudoalteromonas piscicida]
MKQKIAKILAAIALVGTCGAGATELNCDLQVKRGGNVIGNGQTCFGMDFSFGNSTTGKFYLTNISKPINKVIWNGDASCSGGVECGLTVYAYQTHTATATILYKDGTYEETNVSRISYETGH